MTVHYSVPLTRWFAPSGIRWNGTRSSLAGKDTSPFGLWTMVVCCTNVWVSSRAGINPDMSLVSPSIKTATSSPATAMAILSFGVEVIYLSIKFLNNTR